MPVASIGSSSVTFTKNMGQWPDSILYRTDAGGATLWFTSTGVIYQFTRRIERPVPSGRQTSSSAPHELNGPVGRNPRGFDSGGPQLAVGSRGFDFDRDSIETMLIQASFVDANPNAVVIPEGLMEYKCNYFLGNDPAKWRTDVPNYSAITLSEIYPGVDAVFFGKDGSIECEYRAASDEALTRVRVAYSGALTASVERDHKSTLATKMGELRFDGILPVSEGDWAKQATPASAAAPASSSLVYSTYLGGASPDYAGGIAVDRNRCAYVEGYTYSADFPT